MKISEFKGDYRFLSNFWHAPVVFEGMEYPSSEHAYQAAKTLDLKQRKKIALIAKPGDVKRHGKTIELRPDWEAEKLKIMYTLVKDKFTRNAGLGKMLLSTGESELEEGNNWGDRTWGICPPRSGDGHNFLGKILMKVRKELAESFIKGEGI